MSIRSSIALHLYFFETGSLLNLKLWIHSFWEYIFTGLSSGLPHRQSQLAFTWALRISFWTPCLHSRDQLSHLPRPSLLPRVYVCMFVRYTETHTCLPLLSSNGHGHMIKMLKGSNEVQNVVNIVKKENI